MSLRPYQQDALDRARAAVIERKRKRILLSMPTGAGKGHLAAALVHSSIGKGRHALFLAHRRELVLDLAARVQRHGTEAGVILPGVPARPDLPAQVASIQTLSRRELPPADLVIVDECHHATAETWRKVLDGYPDAVIVGFSATPCRMSGAPLGDLFEELIQVTTPAELVAGGFLVPVQGWAFQSPNLRAVPRSRGEFDTGALELLMGGSKVLGNVVGEYQRRAPGSRAIVFAVSREHSRKLAEAFQAAGEPAEHIDGEATLDEREACLARFRSGQTRILCNVALFTEGFDLPDIDTVILAAPTASTVLFLQRVGRGRRPLPCSCGRIPHHAAPACECGAPVRKRFCRLHDHASSVATFGLPDEPRVWTLDKPVRVTPKQIAKGIGSVKVCTKCFAIFAADQECCPACGAANRAKKRLIRNEAGIAVPLEQVKKREVTPYSFLCYLRQEQRAKGHDPRWIGIRFKCRFGRWPSKKDWEKPSAPAPTAASGAAPGPSAPGGPNAP